MKKVFKFFIKNWLKIIGGCLIVFVLIYVPIVAIDKARDYKIYNEPEIETKIYTIWHIETFEGGGKARVNYLKNIVRAMEKNHDGLLFMIKTIQPDKLASELELSSPDIISFGFGVGDIVLDKLIAFDKTYDVRDELIESGSFSNSVYALPYIVSGYAMITHNENQNENNQNFHCGTSDYTFPENIYNELNLAPIKTETSYEAYKSFVYDESASLLGLGRDVFRVNNLNEIGRTNASITPISTYTDLIQYIGITKTDEIIEEFLSILFSAEMQLSLVDYSLFSAKYTNLYSSGIYKDMEDAILNCKVARVFDA